jgi:hypothetical protein
MKGEGRRDFLTRYKIHEERKEYNNEEEKLNTLFLLYPFMHVFSPVRTGARRSNGRSSKGKKNRVPDRQGRNGKGKEKTVISFIAWMSSTSSEETRNVLKCSMLCSLKDSFTAESK